MIVSKSRKEKFITELSNENELIYADVTKEKGGKGKYFRPHNLLESSYASCLNIFTRMIMDSMDIDYKEVIVKVSLDRSDENKTIFNYSVNIDSEMDEDTKSKVMEKIKNCPVRNTLSKEIQFREN